jgi:cobalt-zinc-cadmium efflux system outer membrane protein
MKRILRPSAPAAPAIEPFGCARRDSGRGPAARRGRAGGMAALAALAVLAVFASPAASAASGGPDVNAATAASGGPGGSVASAGAPAATAAARAEAARADLPPEREAVAAISGHPSVRAAALGIAVERANRERLIAGVHEPLVRGDGAQRRVSGTDSTPSGEYQEWGVSVERALRLPGKAALDASLGDQSVSVAELAMGDALHEAGRALLRSWIGWLRESAQYALWRNQLEVLREQQRVTERRLQAGDASRLDVELISAAVAQAEASAAQAASGVDAAKAELREQFPSLALPRRVALLEPAPPEGTLEQWRERVMSESHELMSARARVERQRLLARRADAERTPDPSVGLRLSSERSGAERIAGVFVSIPLAGDARVAGARAALAQIDVEEQRAEAVSRMVAAGAASAYTRAVGSHRAWRAARDAAQRLDRGAALTARGYELGETPLTEVLVARRAAIGGGLAAASLLADAVEARYRLLLDAHMLWPLDAEEPHSAQGPAR